MSCKDVTLKCGSLIEVGLHKWQCNGCKKQEYSKKVPDKWTILDRNFTRKEVEHLCPECSEKEKTKTASEDMTLKIAIRLRIHPPKRRTGLQRLHTRLYYRRNRARIRMQRRRYLRMHKTQLKHRKQFQRFKPTWYKKPKHSVHPKAKFKVVVPKHLKKHP